MYQPQGNFILVRSDGDAATPLLTASVMRGTVAGVGSGKVLKDGTLIRPAVEVGQTVHFDPQGAERFQLGGADFLLVDSENIKLVETPAPLDPRTSQTHEFQAARIVLLAEAADGTVRELCKDSGAHIYRIYFET